MASLPHKTASLTCWNKHSKKMECFDSVRCVSGLMRCSSFDSHLQSSTEGITVWLHRSPSRAFNLAGRRFNTATCHLEGSPIDLRGRRND
jgi:hypothetical protein